LGNALVMTTLRRVPLVIVTMVFSSCGEPDGRGNRMAGGVGEADGSFPVAYDSLRLAEDEQVFIALPRSLLVESDESEGDGYRVWVVDFTANTVLRFGASGEYLGRIGTPGPGPHEFRGRDMCSGDCLASPRRWISSASPMRERSM
jgi:hypothetical protein